MKKILKLIPVFACCIFLWGCPYSSDVPIAKSIAPENRLLGTWEKKGSDDKSYTVTKEGNEYKIEEKTIKSGNVTVYKAILSDVKGVKYLSITENGGTASYSLYKVEVGNGNQMVTLLGVTENLKEKFSSSDELTACIEKYQNLSFFFDKDAEVFTKK
jgi:hypothetical protein